MRLPYPRRPLAAALLALVCACAESSRDTASRSEKEVAAPEPALVGDAGGDDAEAADAADAAPPPKRYARVLHTGDSMVGGGLCRALRPKFEAEGTKFYRDVWESGRIFQFADSDRIPKLLKKIDPDLVLITLGANDVWMNEPEVIARSAEKIAKMVTEGGRTCWWIGPPIWKPYFKKISQLLMEHVAPCTYFDSTDIEMARRPDGVHPTEKGGEVWADAFWKVFRPEELR